MGRRRRLKSSQTWQRMFWVEKICFIFFSFYLFIVTFFAHMRAHTHTRSNALRPTSLLWSFCCPNRMLHTSPRDLSECVQHSSCSTFRATTNRLKAKHALAVDLFIIIYISGKIQARLASSWFCVFFFLPTVVSARDPHLAQQVIWISGSLSALPQS